MPSFTATGAQAYKDSNLCMVLYIFIYKVHLLTVIATAQEKGAFDDLTLGLENAILF